MIGDVVDSRSYANQERLFDDITEGLLWLNDQIAGSSPAQLMTGDEFQLTFSEPKEALLATTLLALRMADTCRFRFGIGAGSIISDQRRHPAAQSGTAWWRAREAINKVGEIQKSGRKWPSTMSSYYIGDGSALDQYINGFLLCRDQIVDRLDSKDARITLALFMGEKQNDTARVLGISQSRISSRQRANGPSAIFRAHRALEHLPEQ